MPSSGARSGTKPSRSERCAGDGRVGPITLRCGHETHQEPLITGARKYWYCAHGCGFQQRKSG